MTEGKKNSGTEDPSAMSCADFQSQLPDLFESGAEIANHPHLAKCHDCSELVRDLQYIAQQAKLLLPMHDPSPEVWRNIQTSIKQPDDKYPDDK